MFGFSVGTIKNLGVTNSYVKGDGLVGGICGNNGGNIENCYYIGGVSGNTYIGGVCGVNGASIKNCYTMGSVSGTCAIGGVCGGSSSSTIENCCYNKDLIGTENAPTSAVGNVADTETVKGLTSEEMQIESIVATMGIGYNIKYNYSDIADGKYLAGLEKVLPTPTKTGYEFNGWYDNSGLTGIPVTEISATDSGDKEFFAKWSYEEPTEVTSDNCSSLGLSSDFIGYYAIGNMGQLYWFADYVNAGNDTANAVLTSDITINNNVLNDSGELNGDGSNFMPWVQIGNSNIPFHGKFNGNNHCIKGIYLSDSTSQHVGMFGDLAGTVQNLNIEDSYISSIDSYTETGMITGIMSGGKINNCTCSGYVTGDMYTGGICGTYNYGSIEKCINYGTVRGLKVPTGGICGLNCKGTISNCTNEGSISKSDTSAGIAALNTGTVTRCINKGNINGKYAGGIISYNGSVITNCLNIGSITESRLGGIADNNTGSITNCYYDSTKFSGAAIRDNTGTVTDVSGKTTDEIKSGEVCYLLNGKSSSDVKWYQNVGTDDYPTLDSSKKVVYLNTDIDLSAYYSNKLKNTITPNGGDEIKCYYNGKPVTFSTNNGDDLKWNGMGTATVDSYYTDKTGTTQSTTDDGAQTAGAAPSKTGTYYVKVTVPEDDTYAKTTALVK